MSLISLCHMNRPMAFSLRSHVTLIRLRNINKAVKIKSQHQWPIRWKCHNYSQNALHHCRRGFRDQSKINESTIHHISIWSQRCVTISYLHSYLGFRNWPFLLTNSRPVVPGCAGCAMAHPDFGRSEGAAGSGGAPHYYVPPQIFRLWTMPAIHEWCI